MKDTLVATLATPYRRAILLGGLAAATLDLTYACIRQAGRGRSPEWTMQSVATGWLGQDAFNGGWLSAALGVVSHYSILIVAAWVFIAASQRILWVKQHLVAAGAVFGALVFLFMNFVVLPASAFPYQLKYPPAVLLEGFFSHAVLVGIPIALAARWAQHSASTPLPTHG
jgi:uncharacterized membrane protein YagU involved in acid resistance